MVSSFLLSISYLPYSIMEAIQTLPSHEYVRCLFFVVLLYCPESYTESQTVASTAHMEVPAQDKCDNGVSDLEASMGLLVLGPWQ